MEKTLVLGECKWQTRPVGQNVLRELVSKTGHLVPKQGQWRVLYLGFAREGWNDAAQSYAAQSFATQGFAETVTMVTAPEEATWEAVGMVLLDLSQVDADLHRWAHPY
jgi:hypothetical protein